MTDARTHILRRLRIRQEANRPPGRNHELTTRDLQPQWETDDISRFCTKLTAAAGSYTHVKQSGGLVPAIHAYLAQHRLAAHLTLAPHPLLTSLEWPAEIQLQYGMADADSTVTLSVAWCGIAETGSLMLLADAHTPTTLNFLADHFLCVLSTREIVPHMEAAFARWRNTASATPRVINLITGPSRTADVEQIIQLGAHGPRQLHVLLLDSDDPDD